MQLFEDRILIKPIPQEDEITKGGIILQINNQSPRPKKGTVIAVGPGRHHEQSGEFIPVNVKVGDNVIFGKFAGEPFQMDGDDTEYLLMRNMDIVMKID
jgi:chaperonin GroES